MPRRFHVFTAAALLAGGALAGCTGALDDAVADSISAPASEVRARAGAAPMPGDPQTLMTHARPARPGDQARAERILQTARAALRPYHDVAAAEAAGYRSFPPDPGPELQVIHYVNRHIQEDDGVDYARPGSLLYERDGDGLRLLGAMYTAPVSAELGELDRRVPLSATQWHLHQNVCVPRPLWDRAAWARAAPDGRPLYGPGSPTVTRAACERLGGRFLPTVFGWMAHVNVFARDPGDVWNAHYGHAAGMSSMPREHDGH